MRKAWTALVVTTVAATLLLPRMGQGGTVTVASSEGRITVDAKEAKVDAILSKLGEQQGFQLRLVGKEGKETDSETISGRFEGSIASVLARILHNENHMIVHSAEAKAGIARIVLFSKGNGDSDAPATAAGAQPRVVAPAPPARTRSAAVVQPKPLAREVIPPPQRQPPTPPTRGRSSMVN